MTVPPKEWNAQLREDRDGLNRNLQALRPPRASAGGFSLIEVTIALGLVSYALLGLLGLFTVGLTSSRDSSMETALSQIVLHASSSYTGATNRYYSYEGVSTDQSNSMFSVQVSPVTNTISNTSTNLHLISISITSTNNPTLTNVIQSAAFVP
jgi:uncharacterized protein (TIGR02598 family)